MPTRHLGSLTPSNRHDVGTTRGSFETMPAGPDRTPAAETWPPVLPVILEPRSDEHP
jgi:hypothetical protein